MKLAANAIKLWLCAVSDWEALAMFALLGAAAIFH
jgi:hypothetical protein